MGVASADSNFFALDKLDKTDKTPAERNTEILLASVTDLDERDKPVTVRRYDIKFLMEFQPHFTEKPRIDTPWEKLAISKTAPELTSTPDKKAGAAGVPLFSFFSHSSSYSLR
jgi:hypothetical protein